MKWTAYHVDYKPHANASLWRSDMQADAPRLDGAGTFALCSLPLSTMPRNRTETAPRATQCAAMDSDHYRRQAEKKSQARFTRVSCVSLACQPTSIPCVEKYAR
jgi:hypothetical protein